MFVGGHGDPSPAPCPCQCRHVLDEGAQFVSVVGTQNDFTCALSSGALVCDGGVLDGASPSDLDPTYDDTADLQIKVRAPMRHEFQYWLTSRIDPGNTIPEANEANNSRIKDVTVKSQVDLTTQITTSMASASTLF